MADKWVIAYDIDTTTGKGGDVTLQTVYNRIKSCLAENGFSEFAQLSVYAMPDGDNALVKVYKAITALKEIPENVHIKRLHVFKIDGALNDVLPLVNGNNSQPV